MNTKPRKLFGKNAECSSDSITRQAAIDGKQSLCETMEEGTLSQRSRHPGFPARHVSTITNMPTGPQRPEVLIIVATLGKRLSFLRETLASIRSQSISSDVVIVGPASDQALAQIAHEFGASLLPDPGSLPKAINYGIEQGLRDHRYVNWLNDDDLLTDGSLQATTSVLRKRPDAVVAFGACQYIDDRGKDLWLSRAGKWAPRVISWGPDLIPQPGMLIRSEAWRHVGGLDTSFRLAFDLDLLLKLKRLGTFVDTNTVVSKFRWHPDSLTVESRRLNIMESERAKRASLGPVARHLCWLWEPPVRLATQLAAKEMNRRARTLRAVRT